MGWRIGLAGVVLCAACDERVPLDAAAATDASDAAATDAPPEIASAGGPTLVVAEGDEVIPQTRLSLSATWDDAGSPIVGWDWHVAQPVGSMARFLPSAQVATPTFEANVAGVYALEVTLTLADGRSARTERRVFVSPVVALHIELLWDTPADPDPTDDGPNAGADLDLHLTLSTDPAIDPTRWWFDPAHDWYGSNGPPTLPSASESTPSLDRDDADGAGPENINVAAPAAGTCFAVGAHSWDSHGFGPSFATLRIYVAANLAFEMSGVELDDDDFWHVTTFCWPTTPEEPISLARACEGWGTACARDDDCGAGRCGLAIGPAPPGPLPR